MGSDTEAIWTVRGISAETKGLVKAAAQYQRISVGVFVDKVLKEAANSTLALPNLETPSTAVSTSDLMEIAAELQQLRERIERLEGGESQLFPTEDQGVMLLKLAHLAGIKKDSVKERLLAALLEALQVADDPWLLRQLIPVIKEARKG